MAIYSRYPKRKYEVEIDATDFIDFINESDAYIKNNKITYKVHFDNSQANEHGYRGKMYLGNTNKDIGFIAMSRNIDKRELLPDKCRFKSDMPTKERNERFDIIGGFMLYAYDEIKACRDNIDPKADENVKEAGIRFNKLPKSDRKEWIDKAKNMRQGYKL